LCHVRVPTWLPCRLQIYFNGHNWLAGQLNKCGIAYQMTDNAFTHIADWQRAQRLSNGWETKRIHTRLNDLARQCCPIYKDCASGYHWSVDQCEYATGWRCVRGLCLAVPRGWKAGRSHGNCVSPTRQYASSASAFGWHD
ncbi:MAG: hypothetical protein ACJ746_31315, partial [Bryobacteraceae bacterium]